MMKLGVRDTEFVRGFLDGVFRTIRVLQVRKMSLGNEKIVK